MALLNTTGYISVDSNDRIAKNLFPNFNANTRNINKWGVAKSQLCYKDETIPLGNNIIRFATNIQSYETFVISDYYTITELAAAVEQQMNNELAGFTITIDEDKRTINIQNATPFQLLPNDNYKSIFEMWGLIGRGTLLDPDGTYNSIFGKYTLNFTNYIDFVSYQINQNNKSDDYATNQKVNNLIERLYLSDDPNQVIHKNENHHIKWMDVDSEIGLNNLEIKLLDDRGNDIGEILGSSEYNLLLLTKE